MPKRYTGAMKTIRGSLENVGGMPGVSRLIFNYESPDRTRGWIVESAWAWVCNPFAAAGADSNAMLMANLATDETTPDFRTILNPDDNRSIGWLTKQYIGKNFAAGQDFQVPNATSITGIDFLLDLDRIVTNDLFINAFYYDSASSSVDTTVAYMIVLREVTLSPSQSLLQQLKGIGQNVDN